MAASRSANSKRPGYGTRSCHIARNVVPRDSLATVTTLHLDDRARAESHEILWRMLEFDAHGKALRDAHPIERPLDVRNGARQVDPIGIEYAPTDFLDDTLDRARAIDHRIDRRTVAGFDRMQIGFPKVPDRKPTLRRYQRE